MKVENFVEYIENTSGENMNPLYCINYNDGILSITSDEDDEYDISREVNEDEIKNIKEIYDSMIELKNKYSELNNKLWEILDPDSADDDDGVYDADDDI